MSDIVERLRNHITAQEWPTLQDRAAAEITRLREENARLREVLKDLIEEDEYQTCSGEEDDGIARAAARAAIREGGKNA